MKPRSVFIIRHGERLDDVDRNWPETCGGKYHRDDPPLTQRGQDQAFDTGRRLSDFQPHPAGEASGSNWPPLVFSSPFLRCVQTASEIVSGMDQRLNPPTEDTEREIPSTLIKIENGLGEFLNERWFRHGNPLDSISPHTNTSVAQNLDPSYESGPGADFPETFASMTVRYEGVLQNLIDAHPGKNIVVVTHGYGIQVMTETLDPNSDFKEAEYCCITKARTEDDVSWILDLVSDSSHTGC